MFYEVKRRGEWWSVHHAALVAGDVGYVWRNGERVAVVAMARWPW
jgi:hypothetical protein